jgi:hypothetical protein
MRKQYFCPNNYSLVQNEKDIAKQTGIRESLVLKHNDMDGVTRASGMVDNPSKYLFNRISDAIANNKTIKCYVISNNSSITKIQLADENFEF